MSLYSRCRTWVSSLLFRENRDADLDCELKDWIDELTSRYEAAGMSPAAARRRALIEGCGHQFSYLAGEIRLGLVRDRSHLSDQRPSVHDCRGRPAWLLRSEGRRLGDARFLAAAVPD